MEEVFLTTLNTDNYLSGVLVLSENIKEFCNHRLIVLVSDDLNKSSYEALNKHNINFINIENSKIPNELLISTGSNLYFGHWVNTLFKLKIFDLVQFKKIVYLDSDMMIQAPLDDLFEREDMSAVVAGKSFPGNEDFEDLNSGLFVFQPREGLANELIKLIPTVAAKKKHFGDQDVLAEYFKDWKYKKSLHLPEEYNVFWRYYDFYSKQSVVKVVHFIGKIKPWMMTSRQVFFEYMKCLLKGNIRAIAAMYKYRMYIKKVTEIN